MRLWGEEDPGWKDDFWTSHQGRFYLFQWAPTVIGFEEIWGMNLRCWFPSVVALRVSFPLDKVLQGSRSPMTSVADDALDFVLLFSINQIWRWAREVWSMSGCFLIGGQE
jgi:hypothetical protein